MSTLNDATLRQIAAADPRRSTWLAANAGSGKTRVLTDRVARLLLDGVSPQNILCLTYTKAAASEMQNRLFERLGRWTMLADDQLVTELAELGLGRDLTRDQIREARTLFARAIETPAGLKIQTIHSFCAALLRRFPLEAGVSPQFTEIDDRRAHLLRSEVLEHLAAVEGPGVFDAIATHYTGADLAKFVGGILGKRGAFMPPVPEADIRAALDLGPSDSWARLDGYLTAGDEAVLAEVHAVLSRKQNLDLKAAERLAPMIGRPLGRDDLAILESLFLTGKSAKVPFSAKIGSFPTKPSQAELQAVMPALEDLMARVEEARGLRLALAAADRAWALHQFAAAFIPAYEARKTAAGLLDFDDLITKARALLTDPAVAQWVLFRLDGGIDHILVDEAQDTSPLQWDVIRLLAQEFTAGEGAKQNTPRSIFVVGDKKQSIYSFQGADPQAFDQMRDLFDRELQAVGQSVQTLSLDHSFRSSPAILQVVDAVFQDDLARAIGQDPVHIAFKDTLPGRVDLWPAIEPSPKEEPAPWSDPIDRVSPDHHNKRLARAIADQITQMIADETLPQIDRDGSLTRRAIHAGDILILVQRRSDLFHEIIRACKERQLPIAGADRLKVGAELAVKDITALLSFLATPEDDLSLACALRSPLFGWSEQDLFSLAHYRTQTYLWQALRARGQDYPATMAVIDELRRMADFWRPFDLIEKILTRFEGRKNLLARLGPEAEEGIDALLTQALNYETTQVPSLTGFLTWLAADELEIKRQAEAAGHKIRVMTVHGSKGLEAPIVILPDTGKRKHPPTPEIIGSDPPFWTPPADATPEIIAALKDKVRDTSLDERMRLLYVAMTRAESWLIVAAAGGVGKEPKDSWHGLVGAGLFSVSAKSHNFAGLGEGMRYAPLEWSAGAVTATDTPGGTTPPLPDFAHIRAPDIAVADTTIAPSNLGGAKALPGEASDPDIAMKRGTTIHILLEHLAPIAPADRAKAAPKILNGAGITFDLEDVLPEVLRVLSAPDLAPLFAPDALVEVDITSPLPSQSGRIMQGAIDRLIIGSDHILAVDFKSNAHVPKMPQDVPEGVLRQLGAYAEALSQIYPTHKIETAIVWTKDASLMTLPHADVIAALQRAVPG